MPKQIVEKAQLQEAMLIKKKLLVCIDWFDPAYKAGGPIRSIVNMAEHLADVFDIYIYTGDRDLNATITLEHIVADTWCKHVSGAHVFYASSQTRGKAFVSRMLTELDPDCIYLNSVFSSNFTIDIILAHRSIHSRAKLVLAARGMLKPSALATKWAKKKLFLSLAKISGIHKSVHFHVTNEAEVEEVKAVFGNSMITVANNFPAAILRDPVYLEKIPGSIDLILIGRVHPIKNIDFILSVLKDIPGSVQMNIIGVLEDVAYWQQCQSIIGILPADKTVRLLGDMAHHLLANAISKHHLFVLPTKGENFGHAIAEALSMGRPVLISDQTPWKDLKFYKAGWDCSLLSPNEFRMALTEALQWNQEAFDAGCRGALNYARKHQDNNLLVKQYQELFN